MGQTAAVGGVCDVMEGVSSSCLALMKSSCPKCSFVCIHSGILCTILIKIRGEKSKKIEQPLLFLAIHFVAGIRNLTRPKKRKMAHRQPHNEKFRNSFDDTKHDEAWTYQLRSHLDAFAISRPRQPALLPYCRILFFKCEAPEALWFLTTIARQQ